MPGPGEYRPDPTEGITRIGDLPKPKIPCQSRRYGRRPCARCGHSAYRDRQVRRTLHDLSNRLTGRPYDLIVIYSQGSSEDTMPNCSGELGEIRERTDIAADGHPGAIRSIFSICNALRQGGLLTLGMVQILGFSGNSTDRPHASTVEVLSVVGPMAGSGTLVAVKAQYV